ncbi:unnamed protein product [Adineta ricciae]|uniref:Uncharacterized protein n=1 Tax=Adineta ricciae TaxID=249248 RepID=A0A814HW89_ADIRI|nr:unnamed protein product [Adineta ricciae]CAF1339358.1 unnamed protein product [Adineta ricciae]
MTRSVPAGYVRFPTISLPPDSGRSRKWSGTDRIVPSQFRPESGGKESAGTYWNRRKLCRNRQKLYRNRPRF